MTPEMVLAMLLRQRCKEHMVAFCTATMVRVYHLTWVETRRLRYDAEDLGFTCNQPFAYGGPLEIHTAMQPLDMQCAGV